MNHETRIISLMFFFATSIHVQGAQVEPPRTSEKADDAPTVAQKKIGYLQERLESLVNRTTLKDKNTHLCYDIVKHLCECLDESRSRPANTEEDQDIKTSLLSIKDSLGKLDACHHDVREHGCDGRSLELNFLELLVVECWFHCGYTVQDCNPKPASSPVKWMMLDFKLTALKSAANHLARYLNRISHEPCQTPADDWANSKSWTDAPYRIRHEIENYLHLIHKSRKEKLERRTQLPPEFPHPTGYP